MKKGFLLLLLFPVLFVQAQSSEFTITDLVTFTSFSPLRFENFLSRKGFKPNGVVSEEEFSANTYRKYSKDSTIQKIIGMRENNDTVSVLYKTNSSMEFNAIKQSLIAEGYVWPENEVLPLYQKANVTVQPVIKKEDGKTTYSYLVEKKALPKPKDINYAEDLLQLYSHEVIAAVFGPENVKKDIFYFSEKEVNKCSVLFPNTSLQVIFIWNDQKNNRIIDFLIIGGSLRAQSSHNYYKPIELNKWQSRLGIYSGMSLKELCEVNGQHISFYGWESDEGGLICKTNNGNINFKTIGAQLTCLDCNEDKYYSKNGILNSADVLRDNRRAYVNTLIILPEKKKAKK